ncbi:DUF4249 family protein [Flavivirga jejuensis]|uniref:DUF4249 family protein n=1 Tax=Flavivirga jejuensis TaxID=870487 RepID=A0ABT8WV06_9FLAO|nr:DUF4249 family protein [Flavivirga jejuensis]MDO5977001.1 DUF4249 family protein [Flavivirga jejuensis]
MNKILFSLVVLVTYSCVDTDADILSSDPLTVEGEIKENAFAEIRLTNSLFFEGIIDSLEIAKSIETKALVEISNGETSEILTLKREDSKFPFLYYRSNIIKGELGKNYDLSITIRGKTFISSTELPEKSEILDINFLEYIEDGVSDPDYRDVKLTVSNDVSSTKYFKVLIRNENEDKFGLGSPFIFNTENISTDSFPLVVRYLKFDDGHKENQFKVNQAMVLQLVAITKEQFDFWKSVKGDESTFVENSSFTNEVVTNISNGAFGYWSGENVESIRFKILEE